MGYLYVYIYLLKHYKKNKQLQSEILRLFNEEASESSKDVVYRIQLGIFDELIDVEDIENLTTIHTQT